MSNESYKDFANKLIESIKNGTAPWLKPWKAGELITPYNATTEKNYSGVNVMSLYENGFNDPRWLTFKQAQKLGYSVIKGEKSSGIIYWDFYKDKKAETSNKALLEKYSVEKSEQLTYEQQKGLQSEIKPFVKFYNVFNATQLKGIDKFDKNSVQTWELSEQTEKFLKSAEKTYNLTIKHDQRDRAYFNPNDNSIHMPEKANFPNSDAYYSTALHELSHWVSIDVLKNKSEGEKGKKYAQEELRAEIATFMLASQLRLPHNPQNNEAYIASWLGKLDKDPYEIIRAARDAEKIKDFIICMDKDLVKTFNLEDVSEANKLNLETWQYREFTKEYNSFLDKEKHKVEFLNVRYEQKDEAKALGAKWDGINKQWFIPKTIDQENQKKLLEKFGNKDVVQTSELNLDKKERTKSKDLEK